MTPVYIFGPTAVGKSDFAITLAQRLNGEVINMDIGSFYKQLSIGVSKPNWQQSPVPHHMFDIVTEPKPYNVAQYAATVGPLIERIQRRGRVPIIVGGSGFYLRSLFFPPQGPPCTDSSLCTLETQESTQAAWKRLQVIDALRASQIHPNDSYRIARALQVCRTTEVIASAIPVIYDPKVPIGPIVCLYDDRQVLYDRINKRVDLMFEQGLLEEAEQLCKNEAWRRFLYKKKLIGYVPLFEYFSGRMSLRAAQELIQKQTRRYAKRQFCFWRMLQKMFQAASTKCQIRLLNAHVNRFDENLTKLTQLVGAPKLMKSSDQL